MNSFEGRNALITGGTRGLGRAIALRLANGGARLALNFRRDEDSAARTLDEIRVNSPGSMLVQTDLEDEARVREMIQRSAASMGGLDIFVANAAATAFRPLLEAKPHNLTRTFNLSIGSFVAAVQEASKVMTSGGRIVMISGIDSIRYLPGHGVLGAAKAALESMVRDLAFELGPRGITVNGVNMGMVDTDSSRIYFGDDFERAARAAANRTALKRLPSLDEIAAVACFLCSEDASYVTAQTIVVDGGLTLGTPWAE